MDNGVNNNGNLPGGAPGDLTPRAATKREFLKLPENVKLKSNISMSAWICYICAAISLIFGVLVLKTGAFALIDVAIMVVLGIGIHLYQSRLCAVILTAYALLNVIYSWASTGRPSGYLMILAGAYALMSTFTLEKKWKAYQQ